MHLLSQKAFVHIPEPRPAGGDLTLQGLDEPGSSNSHPIFNYISSTDFYPGPDDWSSLGHVVKAELTQGTHGRSCRRQNAHSLLEICCHALHLGHALHPV